MKYLISVVVAASMCLSVLAGPASGEEKKIRVLVTVGGHDYEVAPFDAMWNAMPGIQWKKATLPNEAGLLKPGLENDFDVIARYDMVPAIPEENEKTYVELLNKGIGLVSMHHNLGAHPKWDEHRKVIGGKFCLTDSTFDGQTHKQSTWDHDQTVKVSVADAQHPITKGIEAFEIHDEVYGGYWVSPDVTILLTTDHPKNQPGQLLWVTKYGNSPVAYFMLGHDSQAWKNPNYPKLLLQSIRWAACR